MKASYVLFFIPVIFASLVGSYLFFNQESISETYKITVVVDKGKYNLGCNNDDGTLIYAVPNSSSVIYIHPRDPAEGFRTYLDLEPSASYTFFVHTNNFGVVFLDYYENEKI